jgi:hypothetical protein
MYSFALFSKGHIQDTAIPYIVHLADSLEFICKVLNIDPFDLVAEQ